MVKKKTVKPVTAGAIGVGVGTAIGTAVGYFARPMIAELMAPSWASNLVGRVKVATENEVLTPIFLDKDSWVNNAGEQIEEAFFLFKRAGKVPTLYLGMNYNATTPRNWLWFSAIDFGEVAVYLDGVLIKSLGDWPDSGDKIVTY